MLQNLRENHKWKISLQNVKQVIESLDLQKRMYENNESAFVMQFLRLVQFGRFRGFGSF